MSQTSQTLRIPIKIARTVPPWPILVAIIILGGILVTLIFGLLIYQIYFLNRVYMGVQIDGVEVGTLTQAEVQQLVMRQTDGLLSRPITLVSNEGSWTMTAAELGARVDTEEMINQAILAGREGNFIADLWTQFQVMREPINIEPVIKFDSGPANSALLDIAKMINRPARNAQLQLSNDQQMTSTPYVLVTPSEVGRTVDIEITREAIRKAIVLRGQAAVALKVDYIYPTITEVEPTRHNVEALLSQPLTFTFQDRSWTIAPEALADLISFGEEFGSDGIGRVTAHLDSALLEPYFHNLALEINQEPVNAWFDLDTTTWTLSPIILSQNGRTLDVETALAMVNDQLAQPGPHQLLLPIIVEPPTVSMEKIEHLGIKELVSTSTSYFKGSSAGRIQNIAVSASKFHGLVIPPGGIFSFNEHLGDVTAENGFVESLIIQGDRTAVGIGGGVCQVSTTAFRAAFYGGFEIVERWAHGYRVSWYETASIPGLDATVYSPTVDFKFRNDTDNYILIQTETDLSAGTVTFNFYGTSPNRTVIVSDPVEANHIPHGPAIYQEDPTLKPGEIQQVDWAKDGLDVTVYRTVLEGDTVIHQDTIFSRYRPWQAIYKVGPAAN